MGIVIDTGENFFYSVQSPALWADQWDRLDLASVANEMRQAERQQPTEAEDGCKATATEDLIALLKRAGQPLAGSPAEAYLRARAITALPVDWFYLPPQPKFTPGLLHPEQPVLLVFCRDEQGQITGGQRILILSVDSSALRASFGKIAGCPVRIAGQPGPLVICRSVEAAASVHEATGYETWAVFGAWACMDMPVPAGRQMIIAQDGDAPDSPSAQNIAEACEHHTARGVEVWVAETPAQDGSKNNLNDLAQTAGLGAVAAAIDTARRYVPRNPSRDKARTMVRAAVESFGEAIEASRAGWLAKLNIDPPKHMIAATLGLGKTDATLRWSVDRIRSLREAGDTASAAVVSVPLHRLGEQAAATLHALAPELTVAILRGPEADDPTAPGQKCCKQLDAYREAQSLLLDPKKEVCRGCAFAGSCLVLAGKAAKADLYLTSHSALGGPPPTARAFREQTLDHVILDESPQNALVFGTDGRGNRLGMAAWQAARSTDPALDRLRAKLAEAVKTNGPGPLQRASLITAGIEATEAEAAVKQEWNRKIEKADDPDLPENRTIKRAAGRWAAIEDLLRGGKPASGRLTVTNNPELGPTLMLRGVTTPAPGWTAAPVLALDATARPRIFEVITGWTLGKVTDIRADQPHLRIFQDANRSGAKSMLLHNPKASDSGNASAADWRAKLAAFIQGVADKTDGPILIVSNKDTIAGLLYEGLPPGIHMAHFGALRGLNDHERVMGMIVVGGWQPDEDSINALASAIYDEPFTGRLERLPVERLTRDGSPMTCLASVHPDPRANELLCAIRDDELWQAIGRVRGVNRDVPINVIVLSNAILPVPVRRLDIWATIKRPGPAERMMAEGGIAFASPAHAAAAYPGLWASRDAAQKDFGRHILTEGQPSYEDSYEGCPSVKISYRIYRRAEVFKAMVDIRRHPDPKAALIAVIPGAIIVAAPPTEPQPETA